MVYLSINTNRYNGQKTKLTQKYRLLLSPQHQNPHFRKKLTQKIGFSAHKLTQEMGLPGALK